MREDANIVAFAPKRAKPPARAPLALKRGAPFDLRDALIAQVQSAIMAGASPFEQPRTVHQCRVHLKRARALARIGRNVAPGLASIFNDAARDLMAVLSQPRDLTALAQSARNLAEGAKPKTQNALAAVAGALDDERRALPPIDADAMRASLRDLMALAQVWPETSDVQVHKGAWRLAKRARRAYRAACVDSSIELRHEWRKREKERAYAVDLLGAEWPEDLPRRTMSSRKLSEALGGERELILLRERLEANPQLAGSDDAAKRALKAAKQRVSSLRKNARKAGERLHRNGV